MKGKAVMFGAGNIGRGFIGQLFSESGYEVVFVDVVQELLDLFNKEHHYRLQTVSNEGSKDYSIAVSGVDSRNQAAVAEAVAEASICATAVGANVLKFVAPNLAAGLALRAKRNLPPINVIVCENLHGAPEYLRGLLEQSIPEEAQSYLAEKTGLVETVIGRMVPAPTPEMRAEDIGLQGAASQAFRLRRTDSGHRRHDAVRRFRRVRRTEALRPQLRPCLDVLRRLSARL